jgi:enoyl-CoA hydratase/carnithine racemase
MPIRYDKNDRVVTITLDNPPLNVGTVGRELDEAIKTYRDDPTLWCAIVTGAGDYCFSAGGDLRSREGGPMAANTGQSFWGSSEPSFVRGMEVWKPVIAAVNGHATGAGCMLAMACDIRIASENATFGLSEVKLGWVVGLGGSQRIGRLVPWGFAMEMLLTGDRVNAQDAYRVGLVNKVVPYPQLMEEANKLAERICNNAPLAVQANKEAAYRGREMTLEEGLRLESLLSRIVRDTEDAKEGPKAFQEKRKANWQGR